MRPNVLPAWGILGVLAMAALSSGTVLASSATVSYQGTLRNSDGTTVADGNYAMTFAIYDALTDANLLWTESHLLPVGIAAKDGLFSVELGSVTALGALFANNSTVWLEVAADTGAGMETYGPRVPLASAPYAKQAETAANAVNADTVDAKHASELAPPGVIAQYAGASVPAGWLLCNGAAVSTTGAYAGLFAAIGYTYGGSGATFNLPNLTGKIGVGRDAGQTEFDLLGETGGEKAHTLTAAEMPAHTHIQNAHTHTQNAHGHGTTAGLVSWPSVGNPGGWSHDWGNWAGGGNWVTGPTVSAATATNQNTTATNQNTGGGGAHNNLQPYIALNYIIKY